MIVEDDNQSDSEEENDEETKNPEDLNIDNLNLKTESAGVFTLTYSTPSNASPIKNEITVVTQNEPKEIFMPHERRSSLL